MTSSESLKIQMLAQSSNTSMFLLTEGVSRFVSLVLKSCHYVYTVVSGCSNEKVLVQTVLLCPCMSQLPPLLLSGQNPHVPAALPQGRDRRMKLYRCINSNSSTIHSTPCITELHTTDAVCTHWRAKLPGCWSPDWRSSPSDRLLSCETGVILLDHQITFSRWGCTSKSV